MVNMSAKFDEDAQNGCRVYKVKLCKNTLLYIGTAKIKMNNLPLLWATDGQEITIYIIKIGK